MTIIISKKNQDFFFLQIQATDKLNSIMTNVTATTMAIISGSVISEADADAPESTWEQKWEK